jgi:hypothetical protein
MISSPYSFKKVSDGGKCYNTMIMKVSHVSKGFESCFLLLFTLLVAINHDCPVTSRNGLLTNKENETISFTKAHFNL